LIAVTQTTTPVESQRISETIRSSLLTAVTNQKSLSGNSDHSDA